MFFREYLTVAGPNLWFPTAEAVESNGIPRKHTSASFKGNSGTKVFEVNNNSVIKIIGN